MGRAFDKEDRAGNRVIASLHDARGTALVEAAIALPIVIMLLLGIVTYGGWFMAAHSLQEAANDAARAALAGIDADERRDLVDASLANGVLTTGTLDEDRVSVTTLQENRFFAVSLSYDIAGTGLFASGLVPLPGQTIDRTAIVQVTTP